MTVTPIRPPLVIVWDPLEGSKTNIAGQPPRDVWIGEARPEPNPGAVWLGLEVLEKADHWSWEVHDLDDRSLRSGMASSLEDAKRLVVGAATELARTREWIPRDLLDDEAQQ